MSGPHHYYNESPPVYSPPVYSATCTSASQHTSYHYVPYSGGSPAVHKQPQHFYRCLSPPGLVKTFKGITVFMCFLIVSLVASTLVWEINSNGYGGGISGGGFVETNFAGYYAGTYSYSSSYMTPMSAKAAMMAMSAINFIVSLALLVWSFSRTRISRGCRFYLTVFICDIILAILQGIIDIIFAIGVNPMAQSSQSMLYNPLLMMCKTTQDVPSLSASLGAGFPAGFPMYNQHLHHYCYMDPEEVAALVFGLFVVVALSVSAFFAYKTRSKIWRHGKASILWDEPRTRTPVGQDVQEWVDHFKEPHSRQNAAAAAAAAAATTWPSAPPLPVESSVVSCSRGAVSLTSEGHVGSHRSHRWGAEQPHQSCRTAAVCSSSSDDAVGLRKPPARPRGEVEAHKPVALESQCETGYTTGDTGNELEQLHADDLCRLYPEIMSEQQRRHYKREFDSELTCYKRLCAELDQTSDQMHKLNRELDTLDDDCVKYQGVADEYNRLKELKKTPDYQAKRKQCKELRRKLFHIKRVVKIYDRNLCL